MAIKTTELLVLGYSKDNCINNGFGKGDKIPDTPLDGRRYFKRPRVAPREAAKEPP
jgi:hypothetical protein